MTDRVRVLTVILDKDYRSDDVGVIVLALQQNRFVSSVQMNVVEGADALARQVARAELREAVFDAVKKAFE